MAAFSFTARVIPPEAGGRRMPWGKHKDMPLDEVPADYLRWAVYNADHVTPDLRRDIEQVLGLEVGSTAPPLTTPKGAQDPDATPDEKKLITELKRGWTKDQARVKELEKENHQLRLELSMARKDIPDDSERFRRIVKRWFGMMSRKHHPDMGGSAEKQSVVNACYLELVKLLEGL